MSSTGKRTQPRGSANSSRQLAAAAVRGSCIVFKTADETISGYLVGMDDYHWVVVPQGAEEIVLVHKASCPIVRINQHPSFQDEPESTQAYVAKVGSSFHDYCKTTYQV